MSLATAVICLAALFTTSHISTTKEERGRFAKLAAAIRSMRWKLLLTASLVATLVGAGVPLGIVLGFSGSTERLNEPGIYVISALLIPVAAITAASFFVYRHTARRRRLQAMLTALLAIFLTLTILLFGSILLSKPAPESEPAPRRNVG